MTRSSHASASPWGDGAVFAALLLVSACSAAPSNEVRRHVWQEYEREQVRLEAAGEHRARVDLASRGQADLLLDEHERALLLIESARARAALGDTEGALRDLDAARATSAAPRVQERADLTAYSLVPSQAGARAFLGRYPCSPFHGSVLGDLVASLEQPQRLPVLLELAHQARDEGARCHLLLEAGRAVQAEDSERALAAFDEVADAGCAWSEQAALDAISLLAAAARWEEVGRRGAEEPREPAAWAACRALGGEASRSREADACLVGFAERFPGSRKVDDAWYLLAEHREATGDAAGAQALYRRIVDERPDSGRAAQAGRRLEALRGAGGPSGR